MEIEEAIRKAYDMGFINGLEFAGEPTAGVVDRRQELWTYDPPNAKQTQEHDMETS